MNCKTCKWFDHEFTSCDAAPYDIEDITCLLKNILCVLLCQNSENTDEDFWKK